MLNDWGSWDAAFNAVTASLRKDLVDIVGGGSEYTCVPLQGSGTFSVEAAIGTVVPRAGKVLVPNNGAYCARIVKICKYLGRAVVDLPVAEDQPVTGAIVEAALAADPAITHVAQVHCETGAGVLNDLPSIAQVCARRGKGLIVDAMSSFAAIPIDVASIPFDALIAASGKCLEGVPGMGFVIVRKAVLEARAGNAHSLAMDLHDQYVYMEKTTQWRYTRNCETLVSGMAELGFRTFLPPAVQAPIIVTFHAPADEAYDFKTFYARTRDRGYILYPGKLTQVETFRVGCIGAIDANEMRNVVSAVGETLKDMGIKQRAAGVALQAA
jgi:2-aminoethylphosphonate-pyruvate transaminase